MQMNDIMAKLKLLVFLSLLAGCYCTRLGRLEPGNSKIVGGADAVVGEIPWQVAIETYNGIHYCGGSIITERYVISAAHCVDYPPTYFRVVAGTLKIAEPGSFHNVTKITRHKDFNNFDLQNDISIWEIDPPFVFSDTISPIALPPNDTQTPTGLILTTSGWGKTYNTNAPEILQKVDIPVVDQKFCTDVWWEVNDIYPYQICAGDTGKDSCNGDSGGPLYKDGVLYGIVSWGSSACGEPDLPGVYTRVSYFRDWIYNQIGV
ncbi:trypsin-1-like [Neocloeon triangulifer]|uniref:trypsin-1-like n=1 Tax=Neocloeon triangulifer TaxID=2078957 RepID=UPI00286F87E2|nr:trypsin-1-like [Neocloeon triangulifer]